MRRILFHIPNYVPGTEIPVFGFGLLFALWAVGSIALLAWLVRRQGFNAETRSYLPLLAVIGALVVFLMPRMTDDVGLPIPGFGVMLMLGFAAGVGLSCYRADRMGLHPDVILNMAFWMFVGGIVGARLFFIIQYWDNYRTDELGQTRTWRETLQSLVNVTQGGLVVYGSVIGAAVVLIFYFRKHRLPALALLDLIAPGAVLGLAIGRIGCLLNGCCFGGQCDPELPWAVTFPWGSPPHQRQAERGDIYLHGLQLKSASAEEPYVVIARVEPDSPAVAAGLRRGMRIESIDGFPTKTLQSAYAALLRISGAGRRLEIDTVDKGTIAWLLEGPAPRSLPVHPTQVYSAINAGLLCLFLLAYYPFRSRDGEVFALLITIYPVTRILLEIIRTDEPGRFGTMLSISQIVSLAVLGLAIALWIYLIRFRPRGSALPAAT